MMPQDLLGRRDLLEDRDQIVYAGTVALSARYRHPFDFGKLRADRRRREGSA